MNVLGLDPASNFGYAVGRDGEIVVCGTLDLAKRSKQLRCAKVTALHQWLREAIVEYEISAICREDSVTSLKSASRGGKNLIQAVIVHAEYNAIVKLVADQKQLKVVDPVNPATLKAFATGSGRAQKPQMIAAANFNYRLDLQEDEADAADAAHVCAWAMQQLKMQAAVPW
jgi:Holliday junction resolvasome RuvABC endonuclease subunit